MILIFLGHFMMQLDILGEAVRLWILTAFPSILASSALIAIIVSRQKVTKYFGANGFSGLDHEYRLNDTVISVLFAIAEFSLTGSAIIFGLVVKHLPLR